MEKPRIRSRLKEKKTELPARPAKEKKHHYGIEIDDWLRFNVSFSIRFASAWHFEWKTSTAKKKQMFIVETTLQHPRFVPL